jgi:hypothetical protein
MDERVCAADQKLDAGFLENVDDASVEVGRMAAGGLDGLWRHALTEAREMP